MPRVDSSPMIEIIADRVVPMSPLGRLHVQRLLLGANRAVEIVVTAVSSRGVVVDERHGRVALGRHDDPASLDAEFEPAATLESMLIRDARPALERLECVLN